MTRTQPGLPGRAWHPVASSADVVLRHVFQGRLLGRELAVWRADDGYVNVWENRCLHRGVRLSIAVNDGRELKCQYHGWRYSNRTAECTYIPAHPADAPARTICNRTFPVVERHGLVWTTLEHDRPEDLPVLPERGSQLPLRAVTVAAPAADVVGALRSYDADDDLRLASESDLLLRFDGASGPGLTLLVQPSDATTCVVRGVLHGVDEADPDVSRLTLLRLHNRALNRLRARVESEVGPLEPGNDEPELELVPEELAELPPATRPGRSASLRVRVERKWSAGVDVAGFALAPLTGHLPVAQPGAHVDVHLPNGCVRQYSVVNAPGEDDRYVLGVKREPESRGGSACLHDTVREGDVLALSEPRNNFPLRRDAEHTLLVAGGIGVTPLLAMAQTLAHHGLDHELHYFAQTEDHLAFHDRLAALGDSVRRHCGLDVAATTARLREILAGHAPGRQVYLCGPGPMIEAAREIAAECGWPVEKVHFEYFQNGQEIDKDSSFEVDLARSCLTVQVPPGQTILEAVREAGVTMPSSCEQGACGTCIARVIEGEPVHQDVYLNEAEKASGEAIMTCVSRSASPRLVLDL
ncbi:Rieske 2Fe-2S domain-containing protein [Nocardioides antri]|uniref:Rieske 2Fe-2S domain-containing protein n=1 Tax=Nocardioides antri TaxID=2607659 RepID=A0A5B1M485_9ACTN|nr:Rieske 2Fe-2S domain-containing protein [Nocardioides antri]KAA1426587.1 Rieske 2Fe-2S domain-containing protein [Nocardioides antri]